MNPCSGFERITTLSEMKMLEDDDAMEFKSDMVKMARKYIPNYEKHLNHEYFSGKISDLKKGQMLANVLYDNFREIFYGLV